jgi:hypothetical protein
VARYCHTSSAPTAHTGIFSTALWHAAGLLDQPPGFRPVAQFHAKTTARHFFPPSRLRLLPYAAAAYGMLLLYASSTTVSVDVLSFAL